MYFLQIIEKATEFTKIRSLKNFMPSVAVLIFIARPLNYFFMEYFNELLNIEIFLWFRNFIDHFIFIQFFSYLICQLSILIHLVFFLV